MTIDIVLVSGIENVPPGDDSSRLDEVWLGEDKFHLLLGVFCLLKNKRTAGSEGGLWGMCYCCRMEYKEALCCQRLSQGVVCFNYFYRQHGACL